MTKLLACLTVAAGFTASEGATRELFLDLERVERMEKLEQTFHPAVKHRANPVLKPERPWEGSSVMINGSPAVRYDPSQRKWQIWYFAYTSLSSEGQFSETYRPAYATSPDGIAWDRAALGQVRWGDSRGNNLLDWESILRNGCTNVLFDAHDSDASRRYKSLYDSYPAAGRFAEGGLYIAFSPDGLRWSDYPKNPVLPRKLTHDTHTILGWDESSGKYLAFLRPGYDSNDPNQVRIVGRSVSDDFVRWSDPGREIVLRPDARDARGSEFYGMAVAKYESHYVGFIWVYRNDPHWPWPKETIINDEQLTGDQQTVYSELAFSRDGRRWTRTPKRASIVATGPNGDWDDGMVYATNPVPAGDEIRIYYGGMNVRHTRESLGSIGKVVRGVPRRGGVGLAVLRRDGYASLNAGSAEGMLLTKPFRFSGESLFLNIDAGKGSARAEILDQEMQVVAEARPVALDSVEVPLRWYTGAAKDKIQNREVRLRLYLRNAKLYSYWTQ